jgi:histidinol phosphatase-like enzyme (inositol monophosphatase family)
MSESDALLDAVTEVARRAGQVALGYFRRDIAVETKRDGSPVTVADRTAELTAREWIAKRFPNDGIVGEELPAVNPAARRRWIVDPIDGTKTFVRGVPLWGTLIAVCENDDVIAGAAFFPALDEMLVAARDAGCWWNGARASVSSVVDVKHATVLTTDERFTAAPARRDGWQRLAARAALSRSWGDCYGYLLVATGRAEVMVDAIAAQWDTAALQCCVVEAGGVFTSWEGAPTAFGDSAVATNAALAAEARALIAGEVS